MEVLKKQTLKMSLKVNGKMTFLLTTRVLKYFMEIPAKFIKERFYKMV